MPLVVKAFDVEQFEVVDGQATHRLGRVSKGPVREGNRARLPLPFGAHVQVAVTFSEPAYAYMIAFNADGGKPDLLWPVNAASEEDPARPPPEAQSVRVPMARPSVGKPRMICLDDEPKGGLQAFAVVASRRPLPAFDGWMNKRVPVPWRREAGWMAAWLADPKGVHLILPEEGLLRGSRVEARAPPLLPLVEALGSDEGLVEVLAVPVASKEGNP